MATLVGLWHLNGNSTDFSGNNNHGTDTAITYSQANGKFGQGAGFNGSSSFINCGTSATLRLSTFSIAVWIKYAGSGMRPIQGFSATQCLDFRLLADNKLDINSGGISGIGNSGTAVPAGWCHVGVTYNTSYNYAFYINGNLTNSGNSGPVSFSYSGNFQIGKDWDGSLFNGSIDEFQFFNVVKDARWYRQQYALGLGRLATIL